MFYPIRGILTLLGRIAIVAIFIMSAVANKIPNFNQVVAVMRANHVPYPEFLLPGAIVFLLVGGISILVGYKARFGALLLLIFLGLATYYFHNFWDIIDPMEKQLQMIQFMKNVSMMGTMLFIMANGAGPFSLDARHSDTTG
jgi:putative oxidoreductase